MQNICRGYGFYRTDDFESTNLDYSRCLHTQTVNVLCTHSLMNFYWSSANGGVRGRKDGLDNICAHCSTDFTDMNVFAFSFLEVSCCFLDQHFSMSCRADAHIPTAYKPIPHQRKPLCFSGTRLVFVNFLCSQYDSSYPQENTKSHLQWRAGNKYIYIRNIEHHF